MVSIKKNILGILYNGFLLFLYVFNISFFFFPERIRTRILIGGWGFIKRFVGTSHYNKYIVEVIALNFCFVLSCCITYLFTNNYAFWFTQHAALNVVYMFGGIYIAERYVRSGLISYNKFLYYVLIVILLHNILAFLGYVITPFQKFILDIQHIGSDEVDVLKNIVRFHSRAIGFGVGRFFHGGVIGGIGVIISCYLMNRRYISILKGSIILIVVLITGMFIARTTMIGLVGLLLVLFRQGKFLYGLFFKFILGLIAGGGIVYGIYIWLLQDVLPLDWAFELIINFLDSGSVETTSTDQLKDMWVLPDNFRTWLIGDGLFFNRDGTYYMHTDVGYLRTIYAIGLVGVGVYVMLQIYLMRSMVKNAPKNSGVLSLVWILGLYVALVNMKGFSEINFLLYMSYVILKAQNRSVIA